MDRATAVPEVSSVPGPKAKRWVNYHHRFAATSTYLYDFVWDITADSIGPFCTDPDGNVLLDFTCHVASAPLGYNNPKITERLPELGIDDPLKIAGQDFYIGGGGSPEDPDIPGPSHLMDRLVELTADYDFDRVFLSNSGAEAVENAIKLCYAHRGHRAFTFEGAFHGRTLGALSLNRSKRVHRQGYPEVPGVVSVPYCACDGECECGWQTDGPGGNAIADRLHPEHGTIDPSEVAFVILEPIQGEGGYRLPNDRFIDDLDRLLNRYDIQLVMDEIQTGLGRTGKMWGVDHTPLEPDLLTAAKGLRVGATVGRGELFPDTQGRISSTWGAGDIMGSLRGVATVDAIREEDLMTTAIERGARFREGLADAEVSELSNIRGKGLMLAVDASSKAHRDRIIDEALARGLLILPCGYRSIRFLPPLDVTEREIDLGLDLFLEAVAAA